MIMSDTKVHSVVIIGSGPAGLTAGIYAARANLSPLIVSGYEPGGQLMLTSEVENFPGFSQPIMGPKLMEDMREQAKRAGAEYLLKNVDDVDLTSAPKRLTLDGKEYYAHSVIIATGAAARWLPVPAIKEFLNQSIGGVTTCAICDGHFFKGGVVAVVGGGDSAMEEAFYLSRMMKKVYIIHRRDTFRASKTMQKRVLERPNVEVLWYHSVVDVHDLSQKKVTAITVEDVRDQTRRDIPVDALFMAIGHTPNTSLFKAQIAMDDAGYILPQAPSAVQTSQEGVWVAGDVADTHYRQAITAAGLGCMAAMDAERWLATQE